ncbi:hypothetical protein Dimus_020870 [Dionaea muscipula]
MSNLVEKMKTKKSGGGLKFMGRCFRSNDSDDRSMPQQLQQHMQCHQFLGWQKNNKNDNHHLLPKQNKHQVHSEPQNLPCRGAVPATPNRSAATYSTGGALDKVEPRDNKSLITITSIPKM